jgi:hypothetical protein
MKNNGGFSLLSFLLYLMIFSLTTVFICHILSSLIIPSLIATRKYAALISLHIATDSFIRDFRLLQQNKAGSLRRASDQEILFNDGSKDIAWRINNNTLERIEGTFSTKWKEKTVSIIATNIYQGSFIIKEDRNSIEIELIIIPACDHNYVVTAYKAIVK